MAPQGVAPPVVRIPGAADAALLLTCEHASPRLPAPWRWSSEDSWLVDTHWCFDPGAMDICRELAAAMGAAAVAASFTRLLVDPNRPTDAATLIRTTADGREVVLNRGVSGEERARRLDGYWYPYHAAVDEEVARSGAPVLLAIHTFTRDYEGEHRDFELGVLFDAEQAAGERLAEALARGGASVRLNEPYSGRGGFIYSVDRHARDHGRQALEIEVRQDRATDPAFRRELVGRLAAHRWVGA